MATTTTKNQSIWISDTWNAKPTVLFFFTHIFCFFVVGNQQYEKVCVAILIRNRNNHNNNNNNKGQNVGSPIISHNNNSLVNCSVLGVLYLSKKQIDIYIGFVPTPIIYRKRKKCVIVLIGVFYRSNKNICTFFSIVVCVFVVLLSLSLSFLSFFFKNESVWHMYPYMLP